MVPISHRSNHRSAFTLIELLVVIAIIAILAAILFPVFAQARAAARGASSESNLKQLSLGVMMYTQDYDETYPEFQQWGSGPITVGGVPYTNWGYAILPYLKNYSIFADPQVGGITGNQVFTPYYSHYGYNYTALAPYTGAFGTSPWVGTAASLASVARPADLVMLAGRFTLEEAANGIYWYGPGTILSVGGAEPPDCGDIAAWCFSDWGLGGNYSFLKTEAAGQYTGGVSLRKALNGNFAMTDGHVKFMQAGQAASGTTWYRGVAAGAVHITTPTLYKWEASP
jgi:prepilin-type N-terminal cleavage/methylation domain-containing protein/prepilin-type processing-associated H-X9-DG protein